MGLDATVETAAIEFARVTADSPVSLPVVEVALAPTEAIRSGLLATRVVPLEPLAPFPNEHWSVTGVEDATVPFEISPCEQR
jgi:hypothetical protein